MVQKNVGEEGVPEERRKCGTERGESDFLRTVEETGNYRR
jgi:hypothetical protein